MLGPIKKCTWHLAFRFCRNYHLLCRLVIFFLICSFFSKFLSIDWCTNPLNNQWRWRNADWVRCHAKIQGENLFFSWLFLDCSVSPAIFLYSFVFFFLWFVIQGGHKTKSVSNEFCFFVFICRHLSVCFFREGGLLFSFLNGLHGNYLIYIF